MERNSLSPPLRKSSIGRSASSSPQFGASASSSTMNGLPPLSPLSSSDESVDSLRKKLEIAKDQVQESKQRRWDLEIRFAETMVELNQARDRVLQLEEQQKIWATKNPNTEAKCTELLLELKALKDQMEEERRRADRTRTELIIVKEEREILEIEKTKIEARCNSLAAELSERQEKHWIEMHRTQAEHELELKKLREALVEEREEIRGELEKSREDIALLRLTQAGEIQVVHDLRTREVEAIKEQLDEFVLSSQQSYAALQQQLSSEVNEVRERLQEKEAELMVRVQQTEKAAELLAQMEKRNKNLIADVDDREQKIRLLLADLDLCRRKITEVEAERAQLLHDHSDEREGERNRIERELENMRNSFKEERDRLQLVIAQSSKDQSQIRDANAKLEHQVHILIEKLREAEEKAVEVAAAAEAHASLREMEARNMVASSASMHKAELESLHRSHTQQVVSVTQMIRELESERSTLQQRVDEIEVEKQKLLEERNSFDKRISAEMQARIMSEQLAASLDQQVRSLRASVSLGAGINHVAQDEFANLPSVARPFDTIHALLRDMKMGTENDDRILQLRVAVDVLQNVIDSREGYLLPLVGTAKKTQHQLESEVGDLKKKISGLASLYLSSTESVRGDVERAATAIMGFHKQQEMEQRKLLEQQQQQQQESFNAGDEEKERNQQQQQNEHVSENIPKKPSEADTPSSEIMEATVVISPQQQGNADVTAIPPIAAAAAEEETKQITDSSSSSLYVENDEERRKSERRKSKREKGSSSHRSSSTRAEQDRIEKGE